MRAMPTSSASRSTALPVAERPVACSGSHRRIYRFAWSSGRRAADVGWPPPR